MAYLTRRRLELATSLLRRDNFLVGEVGAKAGWLDSNYFSRCFRKHFGMTPSRYRARFLAEKKSEVNFPHSHRRTPRRQPPLATAQAISG